MMGGWKLWLAAVALFLNGIYDFVKEEPDPAQGFLKINGALAMVGLGHKVEKLKQ